MTASNLQQRLGHAREYQNDKSIEQLVFHQLKCSGQTDPGQSTLAILEQVKHTLLKQINNPKDALLTPIIISYKGLKGKCCILSCRCCKFRKRICSSGKCLRSRLSTHESSSMNSSMSNLSLCFVGGSTLQDARKRETETKREGERASMSFP